MVGLYSRLVVNFKGAVLLSDSWFVSESQLEVLDLGLVCCFLQFKKLKELSTAIFDSSINILVVL